MSLLMGAAAAAQDRGRSRDIALSAGAIFADHMIRLGDENNDARLSPDEFTALADRWFDTLDAARTGTVSQEEFVRGFSALEIRPNRLARPGGQRDARRYLGLFATLDSDRSATLTRSELKRVLGQWSTRWNRDGRGGLDRGQLIDGLNRVLPPTNMGTGARQAPQQRIAGLPDQPPSPVLKPEIALSTVHLADGFHVELAAAEPMVEDPIAISFDADGRLFVLEMRSFMLDLKGSDERRPNGRISRLVDTDGDGRFDQSSVFLDGLVVPRSLSAMRGGLLYVADYQLCFAKDTTGDGQADRNEIIDPEFGGGNVEHAANGLMPALDNWIYNAKSQTRYRWFGDTLVKQRTEYRGQWGITQDNVGRLFYNVNNSQLLGDYTPPNYMSRNEHHPTSAGLNLFVATDQRIFTRRMNTAVNRGYLRDVIDPQTGRLFVFASSCSPVIYRGDNYPPEFQGNAFVCDPSANLVKRNLVSARDLTLSSKFAYDNFEFLAASDERFRPVNLCNGPDGTLWLVDMYRGIIQYGMFMTDYLRRETLERELDKGIHLGRIYRIVSDSKDPSTFLQLSSEDSATLVSRLAHPNGWIRDTAQRLLVERRDRTAVSHVVELLTTCDEPLGRIHALWTLEGLFLELPESLLETIQAPTTTEDARAVPDDGTQLIAVDQATVFEALALTDQVVDACFDALGDSDPQVRIAAIRVAESLIRWSPEDAVYLQQELARLASDEAREVVFQVALTAGNLSKPESLPLLAGIATADAEPLLIREAVVSGLHEWEIPFLKALLAHPSWNDEQPGRALLLESLAGAVMRERHPTNVDELLTLTASQTEPPHEWRLASLLKGITGSTTSRFARPVLLRERPAAMDIWEQTDLPQVRDAVPRLKRLLAWPGHQAEASGQRPKGRPLADHEAQSVARGELVFRQVCAGCHGLNGNGIRPLAAPLVESDWVLGSEQRLIRVLLHGLTGPVEVDGITYQPPIVLPAMPTVAALDDTRIADVLSYVRRAWGHQSDPIAPRQVAEIRAVTKNRTTPWTAPELQEFK